MVYILLFFFTDLIFLLVIGIEMPTDPWSLYYKVQ